MFDMKNKKPAIDNGIKEEKKAKTPTKYLTTGDFFGEISLLFGC